MGDFCLHSLHVVEKLAVATPMKEVKLIGLRKPGFKYRGVHHSIVFFWNFMSVRVLKQIKEMSINLLKSQLQEKLII